MPKSLINVRNAQVVDIPAMVDLGDIPDDITPYEFVKKMLSMDYKELMSCGVMLQITPEMVQSIINFKKA